MKRYLSLLKKQILCLVVILLTTTTTITIVAQDRCIDLKLNEKPAYMSTYEWCKKIAEVNVNLKATVLLIFLRIRSEKDWKNCKNNTDKPNGFCHARTVAMSKNIQDCVYNVFNYHEVVKVVKPTSICKESNNNNGVQKIVVQTENFGTIEIMAVSGYSIGQAIMVKDGYIIGLSPSEIKRLKLSDGSIEGIIGHELAHIIYDDMFDWCVLENIYNENCYNWNLNRSEYWNSVYAFFRACETEADIVGTFGNPRWAQGLIEAFKKFSAEDSIYSYDPEYSTHPTDSQRISYLQKVYKSLSKE